MSLDKCRSCSAPIIWCKTAKGKNMPVDAAPSADGTFIIQGGVAVSVSTEDPSYGDLTKYKSHFATCPKAAQHRRAK